MDVTSSTNTRTVIASATTDFPGGHKAPALTTDSESPQRILTCCGIANSFVFDWLTRLRIGGNSLIWAVLGAIALPRDLRAAQDSLGSPCASLSIPGQHAASNWEMLRRSASEMEPLQVGWRQRWAVTNYERLRLGCAIDAVVSLLYGLQWDQLHWILRGCDWPEDVLTPEGITSSLEPKGFWRVDKSRSPELRRIVLTLVAFRDLLRTLDRTADGVLECCRAFLGLSGPNGWEPPETLRLADYDLGRDRMAKERQPVATLLGRRFYDWQLAEDTEESWRECCLHARNQLGEAEYKRFVGGCEKTIGESDQDPILRVSNPRNRKKRTQTELL